MYVDPQVAFDKLAAFDRSYDIWKFLWDQGIKGIPGHTLDCPLALWMREQIGAKAQVSVSRPLISVKLNRHQTKRKADYEFKTTRAILEFIEKYDRRGYPSLVQPLRLR